MSRDIRRHHYARLKKKRQYYWYAGNRDIFGTGRSVLSPRALGMVVSTPHPCSCLSCGNQRRCDYASALYKLSMSERRFLDVPLDPLEY